MVCQAVWISAIDLPRMDELVHELLVLFWGD